jgi:hypothetical protein
VFIFAFLFFLNPAIAAEKDVYRICRAGAEVRTLRVSMLKNGNCVTYYTKAGEDKERASAKQYEVCLQVLTNIEKNLLDNKWKCRDLNPSQFRVTSGDE